MIQLVGYYVVRQGRTSAATADHVQAAVDVARARTGNLVHAPGLKDLSDVDRSFLVHMVVEKGPSRASAVGARMPFMPESLHEHATHLLAGRI